MAVREIILLGNPLLLEKSIDVSIEQKSLVEKLAVDLQDTARAFNRQHGWGRAISAVQIGQLQRVIYVEIPQPWLIINPVLSAPSQHKQAIWDDCMSFPDLLVQVERFQSFTLNYLDENWQQRQVQIDGELAELIQHELDHLDGIVATMRARDGSQFALASQKQFLDQELLANR